MKLKEDKIYYARNYEIAIILSLIIVLLLFVFSPDFNKTTYKTPYFYEPLITIVDIPNTWQSNQSSLSPPPMPEIPSQFIPVDEPELLADVIIKESNTEKNSNGSSENTKSSIGTSKGIYEASSFPFVPRQIVEVVPEKVDGGEGAIKLKLLIGKDGYVMKHEVMNNSSNKPKCLTFVINAVYKSRWQPVSFDGEKVEYWIEKTYVFN
ncbi:MAG: hypothetical protein GYA14_07825 [Ignavibacteria bacterium]|nr:hypothetical protein [Ignavibacteria bacterium]